MHCGEQTMVVLRQMRQKMCTLLSFVTSISGTCSRFAAQLKVREHILFAFLQALVSIIIDEWFVSEIRWNFCLDMIHKRIVLMNRTFVNFDTLS